jgi:integrase
MASSTTRATTSRTGPPRATPRDGGPRDSPAKARTKPTAKARATGKPGAGSIVALGEDHYRLRAYVGRKPDGTVVFKSQNFRGGKKEAQSALNRLIESVKSKQTAPEGEKATVAELFEAWFANAKHSPNTRRGYESLLVHYILPAFGPKKLKALTPVMLDLQYREWEKEVLSTGQVRKASTVLNVHRCLSAALGQAYKWGWIAEPPTKRATPPSVVRSRVQKMPRTELADIFRLAVKRHGAGGVLPTAIALGVALGSRRGELCALRWSDWDESIEAMDIMRSLSNVSGKGFSEGPTKEHQLRTLPLRGEGAKLFPYRRQAQQDLADKAGVKLVADPFILASQTLKRTVELNKADGSVPSMPNSITQGFGRLVETLWPRPRDEKTGKPVGKPRWHFHDLRHYSASEMLDQLGHVVAAEHLGWRDSTMLLTRYGHPLEGRTIDAAEVLGSSLPTLELPVLERPTRTGSDS